MRTLDNEIIIHRNETFTIDKVLQNKDGSPFIISNKIKNPFYLLSISTTRYAQKDRYIKNYWLPLTNYPRFESTEPINILSLTDSLGNILYHDFADFPDFTKVPITAYINGEQVTIVPDSAVFYKIENGRKIYKYYNGNWYDYVCRFVNTFEQSDTGEWVEQSYVYSIQLVGGELATDEQMQTNNGRRLATFEMVIPILPPTKLSVLSALQGGL